MLDLTETASSEWLAEKFPARSASDWPPAFRPLEHAQEAQELLRELGVVLHGLGSDQPEALDRALRSAPVVTELRAILAQLGAARLFRLLHWLSELGRVDTHLLAETLVQGSSEDASALRGAITAFTRRALLERIFAQDRIAALHAATQTALREQS